jgi:hypothetical protein
MLLLPLLAFVWTRSRLLVLDSRFVNSPKLSRWLLVDTRLSALFPAALVLPFEDIASSGMGGEPKGDGGTVTGEPGVVCEETWE